MTIHSNIDPLILPVVEILNTHGFETFDSCQGGEGHPFADGYIRFYGDEHDLLRAWEVCTTYGIRPRETHRVFQRMGIFVNDNTPNIAKIGETWNRPFNELIFSTSSLSHLLEMIRESETNLQEIQ